MVIISSVFGSTMLLYHPAQRFCWYLSVFNSYYSIFQLFSDAFRVVISYKIQKMGGKNEIPSLYLFKMGLSKLDV